MSNNIYLHDKEHEIDLSRTDFKETESFDKILEVFGVPREDTDLFNWASLTVRKFEAE